MKIRLLAPARIKFNAGDVVEASPAQAEFLFSVGGAEKLVEDKQEQIETAVNPPEEVPESEDQETETAVESPAEVPEVKKTRRTKKK